MITVAFSPLSVSLSTVFPNKRKFPFTPTGGNDHLNGHLKISFAEVSIVF
jgi:hypothetical protein